MVRVEHSRSATGGKDDWETPDRVVDIVRAFAPIGLDPCTHDGNPVRANCYFTPLHDGLEQPWVHKQGEVIFQNPPYSETQKWLLKAALESQKGLEVISLVAARPCTRYWQRIVWPHAAAVCFIVGRLTFKGAENAAPFESALIYHGKRSVSFKRHFGLDSDEDAFGKVVIL